MATIEDADPRESHRRLLRTAADMAIIVLLFSTMFSSWALGVVAGSVLVGLLVYAWFGLREPERHKFVARAIVAALAAGAIGAGVALLR
jgi:hypothetical protein